MGDVYKNPSATNYDFAGWATRFNIKCADGRTIKQSAFDECNGKIVPIVFQHNHKDLDAVVGKGLLESRPEGMYMYGLLSHSADGQRAKTLVDEGVITALSIYANQLRESEGNVYHGNIREVSLVLAGANEGAYIEYPSIRHSDGSYTPDDESGDFYFYNNALEHSVFAKDILEPEVEPVIEHADEPKEEKTVADKKPEGKKKSLEDIIATMNEEQQAAFYQAMEYAVDHAADIKKQVDGDDDGDDKGGEAAEHSFDGGEEYMQYNPFEGAKGDGVLSYDAFMEERANIEHDIFDETNMRAAGTFKKSVALALAHGNYNIDNLTTSGDLEMFLPKDSSIRTQGVLQHDSYGVENIDYLFPEDHNLNREPMLIARDDEWVSVVLGGVAHVPFEKFRSMWADITEEDARARGYIKGNLKKEEVFKLLRRSTDACMFYKRQKLDRETIIRIKDFNIVAWLWKEMRKMLNEELARAIVFGDGRESTSPDKIQEDCIHPIISDDNFWCIKDTVSTSGQTVYEVADAMLETAVRAFEDYKGSGAPIMFMTYGQIADYRLMKDTQGYRLYKNVGEIADAFGVSRIVQIPTEVVPDNFGCLIVNLKDYTVGTNAGGEITSFDRFDMDYNQYSYLLEGRCSGMLTKPYSAIYITKTAN